MAKWSRRRARPPGFAAVSWLEVTPSVRAGRLGRARSCAAGAIAAIGAATIWGTLTASSVYDDPGYDCAESTSPYLDSVVSGLCFYIFVAGALGWHLLVERRRPPCAPARLKFDGWLALGLLYAGQGLLIVVRPFAVVGAVGPTASTFFDSPPAAAANAVIALALTGALAVLGVIALTRLAERRDRIVLAWRADARQDWLGA
jgi:hypothetical protein